MVSGAIAAALAATIVLMLLRRRRQRSKAALTSDRLTPRQAQSSGDGHAPLSSICKSERDDEPYLPPPAMMHHQQSSSAQHAPRSQGGYMPTPGASLAYVHPASYSQLQNGANAPHALPPQLSMQSFSIPLGHTVRSMPSDAALQQPVGSFDGGAPHSLPGIPVYNQRPDGTVAPASLNSYILQPPGPAQHSSIGPGSWQAAVPAPISGSHQVLGSHAPASGHGAAWQRGVPADQLAQPQLPPQQHSIVGDVHSASVISTQGVSAAAQHHARHGARDSASAGMDGSIGAATFAEGSNASQSALTLTHPCGPGLQQNPAYDPAPVPLPAIVSARASTSPAPGSAPPSSPAIAASGSLVPANAAVDGGGSSSSGASRASTQGPKLNSMHTAAVQATEGDLAALEYALDRLAMARPSGLFAGRFAVLPDRQKGGQALVQVCLR